MQIELTEVDSSPETRKIVLDRLPVMIGQSPDAAVRLEDHWVSRHHCEIDAIKGTLVVRDLGSILGTFVNGLNVNRALLMPGDKLTVGITSFLVEYERRIRTQQAAVTPLMEREAAQPREEPRRRFPRLMSRLFRPSWLPFLKNGRGRQAVQNFQSRTME